MNNLRYRKEKESLKFDKVEDYYIWFEENLRKGEGLVIESFPHRPFYLPEEKFDYSPTLRKSFSYQFFPFPETLPPEKLKLEDGNLLAPWCNSSDIVMDIWGPRSHYSTDPKVWKWDWKVGLENTYYERGSISELEFRIDKDSIKGRLKEVLQSLKDYSLRYRDKGDYLLLKVGKYSYIRFRQWEIYLSTVKRIRSKYSYEEVRSLFNDSPSTIIA